MKSKTAREKNGKTVTVRYVGNSEILDGVSLISLVNELQRSFYFLPRDLQMGYEINLAGKFMYVYIYPERLDNCKIETLLQIPSLFHVIY